MNKIKSGFKRFLSATFVVVLLLSAFSIPASAKIGETYTSRVGGLRVHKGPSGTSEIVGKVKKGERVMHTGTSKGWWKIRTTSGGEGYVYRTYLKPAGNPIRKNAFYKVYKISNLAVRQAPRSIAQKLGTIKRGTVVQLKNRRDNWGMVMLGNGNSGWVQLKYLNYLRG